MIGSSTRTDEALERLSSGIAQLTSSDVWHAWLRVQARFHAYSFSNAVLITLQRPSAARVAGFATWRRLGRYVRSGERALWILAPVTRRVAGEDQDEVVHAVVAFRAVPVFAEDQTDGEPLPEVCARLHGDDPLGAYAGLVRVAGSLGFVVEEHAFGGETNGDCSHTLRRLRVEVSLAPAHRAKTLAHEVAHALLHEDSDADRGLKELEAESVAFVVCEALGIQADAWTCGYVADWAGGGDAAGAAIKAAGTRIQQTAERILSGLGLGAREAAESVADDPG